MHWRSYDRLRDAAIAAEERMVALDVEWLRTRYGVKLVPFRPEASTGGAMGPGGRRGGDRG